MGIPRLFLASTGAMQFQTSWHLYNQYRSGSCSMVGGDLITFQDEFPYKINQYILIHNIYITNRKLLKTSWIWRFDQGSPEKMTPELGPSPKPPKEHWWSLWKLPNRNDMERWWKMMKDDERWWKMMKDDERWWKMMKDERWWKMMKDDERWWKMMKDDERWWNDDDEDDERWWKMMKDDERWWKMMKDDERW